MSEAADPVEEPAPGGSTANKGGCLILVVIAVFFVGCVALSGTGDDPSGGVEGAAELSCQRYRTAARDARTLAPSEMRERLQNVHRLARSSGNPTLASVGEDMLAEFTNGTTEDFLTAVGRFGEECGRLGG